MVTEQQLEESDTDMSEADESITIVESDKNEGLLELEEETEPSPIEKSNKVAVTPDEIFCLENNLTPTPKAIWVDHNLPKSWNAENNVLSGRSLPSADIIALLQAVHATSKSGEMEMPTESNEKSVEDSEKTEMESEESTEPLSEAEVQTEDEELEGEDTTQMNGQHGSAGGKEVQVPGSSGLEGDQVPARRMEAQIPGCTGLEGDQVPAGGMEAGRHLLLDPCRLTHDTSGDVLRFLSEMRKQIDRLTDMEIRNRYIKQMIVSLHESFHQVASQR